MSRGFPAFSLSPLFLRISLLISLFLSLGLTPGLLLAAANSVATSTTEAAASTTASEADAVELLAETRSAVPNSRTPAESSEGVLLRRTATPCPGSIPEGATLDCDLHLRGDKRSPSSLEGEQEGVARQQRLSKTRLGQRDLRDVGAGVEEALVESDIENLEMKARLLLRAPGTQLGSLAVDSLHPAISTLHLPAHALACSHTQGRVPPEGLLVPQQPLKQESQQARLQQPRSAQWDQHQYSQQHHRYSHQQQQPRQHSKHWQLNLSCSAHLGRQHQPQEDTAPLAVSLLPRRAGLQPVGSAAAFKADRAVVSRGVGFEIGRGVAGTAAEAVEEREDTAVAERVDGSASAVTAGQGTQGTLDMEQGQRDEPKLQVEERVRLSGGVGQTHSATLDLGMPPEEWLVKDVAARVVVRHPEVLRAKLEAMGKAGPEKLQVIADFDRTLSRYKVNGERGMSSHALVEQDDPEFNAKREELFNHYYPKETDPTIPFEEKTKLMEEWWSLSHDLLLEGGLTLDMITRSVAKANTQLRKGAVPFFELLEAENIPLLIFSAGLGDVIDEILRQRLHRSFRNVRIVSNRMEFDDSGKLVGFPGRIIHVLNKNEHALEMASPLHLRPGGAAVVHEPVGGCVADIQRHTTGVLLGDHMGDLGMSQGARLEKQISIGFLNDDVERQLDAYAEAWDIVILDDGPLDAASNLIQRIIQLHRSS